MSKEKVEIICIVDRSGSMAGIMSEMVTSLNEFIEDQKNLPGKAKFTLASFDNRYELIYDRVNLQKVEPITIDKVMPRGATALLDAIGKTLNNAKKDRKTIVLIQTDGGENTSQEWTNESVKKLITEKEDAGWEFVFIGAGVDAFSIGSQFGMPQDKCFNVTKDKKGFEDLSVMYAATATSYRS